MGYLLVRFELGFGLGLTFGLGSIWAWVRVGLGLGLGWVRPWVVGFDLGLGLV